MKYATILALIYTTSCQITNKKQNTAQIDTNRVFPVTPKPLPGVDNPDHIQCLKLGFSPNSSDINNASAYWNCRIRLGNTNNKDLLQEIQKANKEPAIPVESKSKTMLERDIKVCQDYGFDTNHGYISSIKFYRCLSVLMLNNGKHNKKIMSQVDKMDDLPHLQFQENEIHSKCKKLSSKQLYRECFQEEYNKPLCIFNLELKLAIDYYHGIVDCRNGAILTYPRELTKESLKNTRYIDENGNIQEHVIKAPPMYDKSQLEMLRNKHYVECLSKRKIERNSLRLQGMSQCRDIRAELTNLIEVVSW